MSSLALPPQLASLRERAVAAWRGLSRRDRRLATFGGLAVGALLVWLIGVQPALRTLREAPPAIERLDAELRQMQSWAAESRTLRAAPQVAPAQAAAALKTAVARLGDQARLVLQGERATVTVSGLNGDALRGLLVEARATARARPIEAQLMRGARGYDGTVVFAIGSAR